ncbi:MAG: hypothetical protein IKD79_03760 [Oscillospiraceae bacterium]|nr:hypothetical protein [Oscillospiraceae bacterium]
MKRTLAILLALLMLLALAACGGGTKETPATQAPAATQAPDASSGSGAGEAPASSGTPAATGAPATQAPAATETTAPTQAPAATETPAPTKTPAPSGGSGEMVSITLTGEFFDTEATEEELRAEALEEGFADAVLNEDGTLTYTMTKERQEQLLKDFSDAMDEALFEMTEGEDAVPSFRRIEAKDDYTAFDVYIDTELYDSFDAFYALSLSIYGASYQAYSGIQTPDCEVRFVDYLTGDVVDSVTYSEWMEMFGGLSDDDGGDYEWSGGSEFPLPEMEAAKVLEENGVSVTVLGFEEDSFWGPALSVQVENGTEFTVFVSCADLVVNDYCITGFMYSEVEPGGSVTESVSLSESELEAAGIKAIGKIDVRFTAFDSETYEQLGDSGLQTLYTDSYGGDLGEAPEGKLLYEKAGVRITCLGLVEDSFWESRELRLMVENERSTAVNLDCDHMTINGIDYEPWFYCSVLPGKKAVDYISISDSNLTELGIEEVQSIEISLSVSDDETYEEIFYAGPLTIDLGG